MVKKIPQFVINNMKNSYERPDYNEGFDEIFLINEKSELTLIDNKFINVHKHK